MNARTQLLRINLIVTLLVSLGLAAGCSNSNSNQEPTTAVVAYNASEESPVNVDHNELGQAVNVSVTLDQGGGVSALIPQSGGEISITMANGLIYTLTIPEGALLSDQEVTMTPIRSLDGTGLADGLIGGVQLEPDGTYLLEPAMLTISAPEAYNLRQMVGFAYHGQGESFHLYPAEGDGNTITLQLISFSGHGATTGTDQQIADQAGQATSSAADSFEQDIAKAMHDAKEKGGDISSVNKVLLELMKDYYDKTLKPTLQTAAKDDTQIDAAEMMYADWRYKAEVLGLENDLNSRLAEALDLLIKGLKNAYDKANQRCIADQNIDEGEHMLKRLTEIAVWTDKTGGYSLDEKIADFERCVRYELNLDSVITTETGANFLATTHATGDVIMKMDPSQPSTIIFKGTGELIIVDYSFELLNEAAFMNSLCVTAGSFGDGTLEVLGKISWYNLNSQSAKQSIFIGVKPSFLDQSVPLLKCDMGNRKVDTGVNFDLPLWSKGFDLIHKDVKGTVETLSDGYWFTNFVYGGGDLIATLGKSGSYTMAAGAVFNEELTIDIYAAPGAE